MDENASIHYSMPLHWPPIQVDLGHDPARLEQMFEHLERTWSLLGDTEPHWSVVSIDKFRSENLPADKTEFYDTGKRVVRIFDAFLRRNNLSSTAFSTCLEFGCGVGRVTGWLADRFRRVTAVDISESHLKLAREHMKNSGIQNVDFVRIGSPLDLGNLEPVDVILTVIVLQHNPPPVMAYLLEELLKLLRPGGVAFFQVPTYGLGYSFDAENYLKDMAAYDHIEMHVLPQNTVFQIIQQTDCIPLEVREDHWAGTPDWISNTFLVQKRL